MTGPRSDARPDALTDLTRWNRAGLSRLQYVDGDAALWLEELRLALFGLYLRGVPVAERLPERWRDVFLRGRPAGAAAADMPPQHPDLAAAANGVWPDAALMAQAAGVQWSRLAPVQPPRLESPGQRNARLLAQYDAPPDGDHAWEIARAFARAAHLVLGHLNAYAGEGYLRTATQWDNLRRLAAMVNHQPCPPASATAEIALTLKPGLGAVTVARGLAMKYAPPAGGAPLIFETLADLPAHPGLNGLRPAGWNVNAGPLGLGSPSQPAAVDWIAGPRSRLAAGDLAVVAFGADGTQGRARAVRSATPDDGVLRVLLDEGTTAVPLTHQAQLWIKPAEVRNGEPQTGGKRIVLDIEGEMSASRGDMIRLRPQGSAGGWTFAEVQAATGGTVVLEGVSLPGSGAVEAQPMAPAAADAEGWVTAAVGVNRVYFMGRDGLEIVGTTAPEGQFRETAKNGTPVLRAFRAAGAGPARGFLLPESETEGVVSGTVRPAAVSVLPGVPADALRTVAFRGKPPAPLATGAWVVARQMGSGNLQPLRVLGVTTAPGLYHVLFHADVLGAHDRVEFHGPLTEALRPAGHDRNPAPVLAGGTVLVGPVPPEALALVKPGRRMLLSRLPADGAGAEDLAATITGHATAPDGSLNLSFRLTGPAPGWPAHEVVLRLNVTVAGHGESKGARLLGSGDAERGAQVFRLPVRGISHVASSSAVAGVVPDLDVAVDGRVWPQRDLTDPAAEGLAVWSPSLTEDGELLVQFRRRLPTGTNNITVLRHRVGTGAAGSGVPAGTFREPMKKHPLVEAIHQPFATTGGADRESVAALRSTAPARLSANGRAVSLADLQRLAEGHSAIWKARAEEVPEPGRLRRVRLTLVPAQGGLLSDSAKADLRPAILSRAVPGLRLDFADFGPLPLHVAARVRTDLTSFDADDVTAACMAAVAQAFGLERRGFGQPVYLAEVLAALEAVPEVETATVSQLDLGPELDLSAPRPAGHSGEWPANVALRDGGVAAIFPTARQVAFVPGAGQPYPQGTVQIEVEGLA